MSAGETITAFVWNKLKQFLQVFVYINHKLVLLRNSSRLMSKQPWPSLLCIFSKTPVFYTTTCRKMIPEKSLNRQSQTR